MRLLPACLWILAVAASTPAARAGESEAGMWLITQVSVPVTERIATHLVVQNRFDSDIDRYQRTVIRPWITLDLPHSLRAALGYDAHNLEQPETMLENRFWQRIAYSHDFGRFTARTHFWQELRFFEGDSEIAWRSRFNLGLVVPLSRSSQLIVRNELFFNLNETENVAETGLGEDQAFVGIGYRVSPWLALQAGYLMVYLDRANRPDLFSHVLSLGLSFVTPSLDELWRELEGEPPPDDPPPPPPPEFEPGD